MTTPLTRHNHFPLNMIASCTIFCKIQLIRAFPSSFIFLEVFLRGINLCVLYIIHFIMMVFAKATEEDCT